MLVEVLLEFLVGIVNVKLLEPVHLEGKKKVVKNMTTCHRQTVWLERFTSLHSTNSHLEVFKAKDIQNANRLEVVLSFDFLVNSGDDPRKTLGIQCHGHRVPGINCLWKAGQRQILI